MRIVVDGAAGSGKSTFLGTRNYSTLQSESIPTIVSFGFRVFSELVRGSLKAGENAGIVPPKNYDDWSKLFQIMFTTAEEQYSMGAGNDTFWYDRGMPFISAFGTAHNVVTQSSITNRFPEFKYDYVFIFKPIESYDLSIQAPGKLKPLSLADRYKEHNLICELYEHLGHRVYEVPVFSDNLIKNFSERLNFIKKMAPEIR